MFAAFPLPPSWDRKYWLRWSAIIAGIVLLQIVLLLLAGAVYRSVVHWRREEAAYALPDPNVALLPQRALAGYPRFRFEWWRMAGRLTDAAGRAYAFTFRFDRIHTFDWADLFRRRTVRRSDHFYAYLALAEIGGEQAVVTRRRDVGDGKAVALAEQFDLRLGGWRFSQTQLPLELTADDTETGLRLKAEPDQKTVLYGRQGYQWRGAAGAPVYLAGLPALDLEGTLVWRGEKKKVSGRGFLEHEITSYALPRTTPGWDRLTLSLGNNHQLKLVRLRLPSGETQPDAPLAVVLPNGETVEFTGSGYDCRPTKFQPETNGGKTYPIAWNLRLEHYQADLNITVLNPGMEQRRAADNQPVWEGLCQVEGTWRTWPVRGFGSAELTGYRRMWPVF